MIFQATTDEEILSTRDVMLQLRPHLDPDDYLPTVQRMMQTDNYHLAAVQVDGVVRAVAGYRYMEVLYAGKILYVDDLNTDEQSRSQGHGKALIDWLKAEAQQHGCQQLHLDSGTHRESAHRFYFRERLTISAYHFRIAL